MEALELVKEQIKSYVDEISDSKSKELLELLPSGKMLRSKLILKIAGANEQSIRLCAIVEMIHAASLLHDDVIDDATTRRGQETINSLFDNKTSIMFGDILYSKAFTELTKMPNDVSYAISNAVTLLSVGELLDVELSKTFNTSYDRYLDMIYKKTASLIEASAYSAASLSSKNLENFKTYGRNLGLAFQMVDDILDITEDSQKLGKPAMLDFVEGKVTIPYLLLFDRLDDEDKSKLVSLYKKTLNANELSWIKTKMETTLAIQDSIDMGKKYGFEAIEAIKDESNDDLILIMKAMIDRDF